MDGIPKSFFFFFEKLNSEKNESADNQNHAKLTSMQRRHQQSFKNMPNYITLVNVYVDLLVFTRIAGTS